MSFRGRNPLLRCVFFAPALAASVLCSARRLCSIIGCGNDGEAVPNGRKYVLRTDVPYRYTHRTAGNPHKTWIVRIPTASSCAVIMVAVVRSLRSDRDGSRRHLGSHHPLGRGRGQLDMPRDVLSGSASSMGSLALVHYVVERQPRSHALPLGFVDRAGNRSASRRRRGAVHHESKTLRACRYGGWLAACVCSRWNANRESSGVPRHGCGR